MGTVDFLLNLAGLLLWVNWVLMTSSPRTGTPKTLLGTLRPAEPRVWRRWYFLATLPMLLTVRAWLYWEIGGTTTWTPSLDLGVIGVAFRCDLFQRAFFYSVLSFGVMLALFYLWLLLLSILHRESYHPDPFGRFVQLMLGPVARLPAGLRLLLPLLLTPLAWLPLSQFFAWMNLLPEPDSVLHQLEQGLLVGLAACLTWSHLLAGVLLLHLVNTYVYLGEHPLWPYIRSVAGTFLRPMQPLSLRMGRVDFTPVVALGLVYLAARGGDRLLLIAFRKLPL